MSRAFLLVLDSLGVGGAPDAARYGDAGSDTVGNIALRCAQGDAEHAGHRSGALHVPTLASLGLGEACRRATGRLVPGLELARWTSGSAGCAAEVSAGKDSQSGHWEISGAPVLEDWGYFTEPSESFPRALLDALCERGGIGGVLGRCHASGTRIIEALGAEHVRTGWPICYTNGDSVFQIAAHEESFGLQRLYALCEVARTLVDPLRIGRVIARPFTGSPRSGFQRTRGRRDFGVPPPDGTLLQRAAEAGRDVVSVGKVCDLFCHRHTGRELPGGANDQVFDQLVDATSQLGDGGLVFANFIDFDTVYGHRRDVAGYAGALEDFDRRLPEFLALLRPGDIAVLTGDHGCDPTWPGAEHTRECVPVLAFGPGLQVASLGRRDSFADIGASLARHLGLPLAAGAPFGLSPAHSHSMVAGGLPEMS